MTDDDQRRMVWSYGNYVMDDRFHQIDPDFRKLIVDCMMERPSDRPSLRDIETLIRNKLASEWPDNDRQAEAAWAPIFWESPPPPPPKPVDRLDRVS